MKYQHYAYHNMTYRVVMPLAMTLWVGEIFKVLPLDEEQWTIKIY